jgi:RHS repeat-associated protein
MPLLWQRQYSSDNPVVGWLGQGWSVPVSLALRVHIDQVVILDAQHREVTFSLPAIGQSLYSPYEQVTLSRPQALRFELTDAEQTRHLFTLPDPHADMACLSAIIDRNGNTTRIQYDHLQQPVRIFDSAGRTYALTFAHQRLQTVALLRATPDDLVPHRFEPLVHYEYDEAGDLVRVRNRRGQVTREFAYRQHLLVRHSRPGGLVAEYEYDHYRPTGKVIRHWANTRESWSFAYHPHETVVTDGLGRTRSYRFDDQQRLTGETDPLGGRTERVLDRYGNLLAFTDAAGRTTRYRHDARSLLTRIELPDGTATRIVQDGRVGKPALVTDAAGNITAYRYDARGNLASMTDALGHQTRYRYDEQGLPVAIVDAHGKTRTLAYNHAGQLLSYTDCSGQSSTFDYDGDGRLTATTNALGQRTGYDYEALGQLAAMHYPDGSSERYEYDALGRLVAHTDGAGGRTVYAFDVDGKPLIRTNALGHTLQYRYDAARRLAQLVNENGAVSAFAYDAADRLVQEIGFDARLTRYRYDASGLAIGREEFGTVPGVVQFDDHRVESKITTLYGRDINGRLVDRIVSQLTGAAQAEQLHTSYGYDALGRLVQARNAQATVTLRYDALGQLLSETTTADGIATTVCHAYDALGNRIGTTLPDGRVLQQLFYGSGHLHQVRLGEEVITDIERDAAHREIRRTQGALVSQFQYDPMGRLKAQLATLAPGSNRPALVQQRSNLHALEQVPHESATQIGRQYAYDRAGNLVTLDDQRLGRTSYTYDRIGRILSALQPNLAERFAFDPAHNLLDPQASESGSTGRIVNNRVTVYEDKRYGYDTHGNLVDKRIGRHTQLRLKWNAEHQLVESQVTRNAQAEAPTFQKTRYGYDPFGRRLYKRDAFGVTRFVWDGNRLLSETRGRQVRTWVYEPDAFVPIAQVDSTTATSAPHAAQAQKSQNVRYIHTDHLGTPRELTSGSGEIVWAGVHKAWGNLAIATMPAVQVADDQDMAAEPSAFIDVMPLRFQGQYYDSETGLHYNRFRYYDPDSGRFVSQDPIGLQGGNNLYQYAPNPISWIDPLGLTFEDLVSGAVSRTGTKYQGAEIYKFIDKVKINGITFRKGDYFYLDNLHKDHFETFSSNHESKGVFNLDGKLNESKTKRAEKRRGPGCFC